MQLQDYFYNDTKSGDSKFILYFLELFEEFADRNGDFLYNLPKISIVKQNKKIDKLMNWMIKDIKIKAKEDFKDHEIDLIDKSKHYLEIILDDFVSESHTNWKNQTKRFFNDLFSESQDIGKSRPILEEKES